MFIKKFLSKIEHQDIINNKLIFSGQRIINNIVIVKFQKKDNLFLH